jgi:hypothetical protein
VLRIARGLQIDPDYYGGGTFGLLGKKGAGKTYATRVLAEELWRAMVPFVLLDPMGVGWGLRSSADGERKGIPVPIFGGKHADAPLEEHGGALLADLVVDDGLSMVLDLSGLGSHAAERRFALGFMERLYRRNDERLVHLLVDEADLFAPQKPSPGDAPLLGVMENIVRRGRNHGIGITMLTQRPAVLNKDVLTQVDGLALLRITSPQDRDAADDWMKGHADRAQAAEVKASLATLKNGESWWWIPELDGLLKRVQVRKAQTFDSSPTRRREERRQPPKTVADVDLAGITERMGEAVERAKREDPRELRKQVAELERALAERPATEPERVEVEVPMVPREAVDRCGHLVAAAETLCEVSLERAYGVALEVVQCAQELGRALNDMPLREDAPSAVQTTPRARPVPAPVPRKPPVAPHGEPTSNGALSLGKAHRAILTVLALHPEGRTKVALATETGYSHSGGGFNNPLGSLRTAGYITPAGVDVIRATQEGLAALGPVEPLPTGPALLEHWCHHREVGGAHAAILRVLAERGPMSKEELAHEAGMLARGEPYAVDGGGFNNPVGKLRTLGLMAKGHPMRLSDEFAAAIA